MILITGANGFVGHKLMELCKDTAASPSLRNVTQEMVNRMIEESNAEIFPIKLITTAITAAPAIT